MASSYLSQTLSQFSGAATNPQYLSPTVQNLSSGTYASEILDIKEVVNADGSLEALDFYHKLTDSGGNPLWVRFRYYNQELAALAKEFSKYPSVKTWQDAVGLQEQITVSPKATGNYMRVSIRAISNGTTGIETSLQNSSSHKSNRGLTSRKFLGAKSTFSPQKQALLSEIEDDEFDVFLPTELDED